MPDSTAGATAAKKINRYRVQSVKGVVNYLIGVDDQPKRHRDVHGDDDQGHRR